MEINLCQTVLEDMKAMEFKQSSIDLIVQEDRFAMAYDQPPVVQRTHLTMIFHSLFMCSKISESVPREIRMSLNLANGFQEWIDDVKLVILPFLKENEESFF